MSDLSLTKDELSLLLESLSYTKKAFAEYAEYPSYGFKLQRIAEVDAVIAKVREAKKQATSEV